MKRIALLIALLAAPLHAEESLVCDVFGDELNCQVVLDKLDDIFDDHNGDKDVEVGTEDSRLICFEATGLDLYGSITPEVMLAFLPSKFATYIHYCVSMHIVAPCRPIKTTGSPKAPSRLEPECNPDGYTCVIRLSVYPHFSTNFYIFITIVVIEDIIKFIKYDLTIEFITEYIANE